MNDHNSENIPSDSVDRLFLPDFCSIRMVFAVMVVAQLLAFILVLSPIQNPDNLWDELGILSLFIQWVALSSTALLCISRRWLARLDNTPAGIISYILVLLVTVILSEVTVWIIDYIGLEKSAEWHATFLLRNLIIGAIVSAITLRLFYLQHEQRMHQEIESNARIQALQARIRPHFLFNSMNTIAALIRSQPDHAEKAVEDLSELFRASLNDASHMVTLETEFETGRRYLEIERLRLGDRLQVEWELDDLPMNLQVPALILQPLLENAIYHGIEMLPDGGLIKINGACDNNCLKLVVSNPVASNNNKVHAGNHIAISNINERLQITFGQKSKLNITMLEHQCDVEISIPVANCKQSAREISP